MADIVVRGMAMPHCCSDCPFEMCCMAAHDLVLTEHRAKFGRRPAGCPLIALPEGHGRLVDVDALIYDIRGEILEMQELLSADVEGRCKVGDTVWKIVRHRVDVSGYRMEWEWETTIEAVKFRIEMTDAVGKTVFRTREEAEEKLAEEKLKEKIPE